MPSLRNPFCNLKHRAAKGSRLTVAFFGGSITWGGNASDVETTSYRALVGDWFRKRFSDAKVTCVNGGFGGTGSIKGAYRFEEHVLSHRPDLVFMEFAVNDSSGFESDLRAAHEAIFRKGWTRDPGMGFVLLISGGRNDRQTESLTKRIGADFGLHVVDIGSAKRRMLQEGVVTEDDLWDDAVHPNDLGHAVYAREVTRALGRLHRAARAEASDHVVPDELVCWKAAEYLDARLIPAAKCDAKGRGWKLTETHHRKFDGTYPDVSTWPDRTTWPFPYRRGVMRTSRKGDSISYTGRMKHVGVAVDYVKGLCRADVLLDGALIDTLDHEQTEGRFPRVPEFGGLLDGGKHTLTLVLREGSLNLGYFMVS